MPGQSLSTVCSHSESLGQINPKYMQALQPNFTIQQKYQSNPKFPWVITVLLCSFSAISDNFSSRIRQKECYNFIGITRRLLKIFFRVAISVSEHQLFQFPLILFHIPVNKDQPHWLSLFLPSFFSIVFGIAREGHVNNATIRVNDTGTKLILQ